MKALHPVQATVEVRMPDPIQVCTLAPEYKTATVINAPAGIGTSNWDACIILPPSDTVGAYVMTNATGIDFGVTVASSNTVVNQVPVVTTGAAQVLGIPLNMATGATGAPKAFVSFESQEGPAAWRTIARSATVYATGSELYNQGTVYAAQYARESFPLPGQSVSRGAGINEGILNIDAYSLPLREADMATMTPGFYTSAAKEGVYTVHRLTGPSQDFVRPRAPASWRGVSGVETFLNATDPTNWACTTTHAPRFFQDLSSIALSPGLPVGDAYYTSSGFDQRCTWGVVIFRGLHPSMSLTLKTVSCLEIVPRAAAPSRQFVKSPAKYEPTAIAAYYAIASEVPNCMAAKHNFLGTLLPILSSVASRVLPFLAPMASGALSALGQKLSTPSIAAPRLAAPAPAPQYARAPSVQSRRSAGSRASSRGRVRIAGVLKKKGKRKR